MHLRTQTWMHAHACMLANNDRLLHFELSPLGLDPSDPKVEDTIRTLLAKRVDEMIQKARESAADVQDALPEKLEVQCFK